MARRAPDQSTEDSTNAVVGDEEVVESVPARPDPEPEQASPPPATGPQFVPAPDGPGRPGWVPPASPPIRARLRPPDQSASGRPRRQPRGPRVVQGRRSRRVVRRIDSWTVFKLSFVFYLCGGLILLTAGVALWNIAGAFDVITNVEKFVQKLFDLQSFKIQANVILGYSAIGAGMLVLLGTGANVLMALLYNLISDVIGGVQVIVLEEQDIDGPASAERGRGRVRGHNPDGATRRRDRPPADDPSLSP